MTLTLREKIGARLERASFYSQVILGFAVGNVLYFAIKAKDLVKKADSIDLTSGLFHRLLSEEELKKARATVTYESSEDIDRYPDREYFEDNRGLILRETFNSLKTRRIAKGKMPNKASATRIGYDCDKVVTSIYDDAGRLKQRNIFYQGDCHCPEDSYEITFNPPGRIFGKRTKLDSHIS